MAISLQAFNNWPLPGSKEQAITLLDAQLIQLYKLVIGKNPTGVCHDGNWPATVLKVKHVAQISFIYTAMYLAKLFITPITCAIQNKVMKTEQGNK